MANLDSTLRYAASPAELLAFRRIICALIPPPHPTASITSREGRVTYALERWALGDTDLGALVDSLATAQEPRCYLIQAAIACEQDQPAHVAEAVCRFLRWGRC